MYFWAALRSVCPLHCPLSRSDGISPWGVIGLFFLAQIPEKNNISGQHSSTSLIPTFILVSVCQHQLDSYYCPFTLHWSGPEDYKYLHLCSCVSCLTSDRHNRLSHPSAEQDHTWAADNFCAAEMERREAVWFLHLLAQTGIDLVCP